MPWKNLWKISIHSISLGIQLQITTMREKSIWTQLTQEDSNENDSNENDSNENDLNDEAVSESNEKNGETISLDDPISTENKELPVVIID